MNGVINRLKIAKKPKIKTKINFSKCFKILLTIAGMILFISNPKQYIASFSNGLSLFAKSVLPALFPFFFFTKTLTSLGGAKFIGKILGKPIRKAYNTPKIAGYIFAMSLMSGYPIGASVTSDFYNNKLITREDALAVTAFCSTSGPLFVLGTVNGFFDNYKFAVLMLLTNYFSALINGFLYRNKQCENDCDFIVSKENDLSKNIRDSIASILMVGGFIALFNMIADMLSTIGILPTLGSWVDSIFSFIPDGTGYAFFVGIIEMTKGCVLLSVSGTTLTNACLCSFVLAFGGVGIAMQSIAFLQKCNVKPSEYFIRKFSQATIALILTIPLSFLFLN